MQNPDIHYLPFKNISLGDVSIPRFFIALFSKNVPNFCQLVHNFGSRNMEKIEIPILTCGHSFTLD